MSGPIIQVFALLFLLLGLLAVGIFLRRSGLGLLDKRSKSVRKLVVSETRMMGNRQFLVVAEYEGKKMLIGVCPGRIDYLCNLAGGEGDEGRFSSILPEGSE